MLQKQLSRIRWNCRHDSCCDPNHQEDTSTSYTKSRSDRIRRWQAQVRKVLQIP